MGQLGFVPPGLALDAIEVSAATAYDAGRRRYADPLGLPAVTNVGGATVRLDGREVMVDGERGIVVVTGEEP